MISALERLTSQGGPLVVEPFDANEFAGLLRSGRARLADAANTTLSPEGRFDLAYNAAHALCLAALRRCGVRARHRYVVFQVLPHTLGLEAAIWRVLDKAHQLRNLAEYEGHAEVDMRLLDELIAACAIVDRTLHDATSRD